MNNKIYLITGFSSGLGKGTATIAAKKGIRLVLLSRDSNRAKMTYNKLKKINSNIEWIPADLSSRSSIIDFINKFKLKYKKLDVLFNCAGVQYIKRKTNEDGLEMMFATNYLGHFLLTNLLFPFLKKSSPALVVSVSGSGHKKTLAEGFKEATINIKDLQGKKDFNFIRASKQAVLAKIIFTYEIARRWKKHDIFACTLCPGLTKTNLVNHLPWYSRLYFNLRCFLENAQTPEQAGKHIESLAQKPDYKKINGRYFEVKKGKLIKTKSIEESYNKEIASLLWEKSEKLIDKKFNY